MTEQEPDVHAFYVEVTVAAAIQQPDGHMLGGNMVDLTVGFAARAQDPPEGGATDEEINKALTFHISRIVTAIADTFAHMGFIPTGQVADPMGNHAKPTGTVARTLPITVIHPAPGDTGKPS